MRFKLLNLI